MGFEVVTATSTDEEINLSNQWAEEYELSSSCGSDYHGWSNQRNSNWIFERLA